MTLELANLIDRYKSLYPIEPVEPSALNEVESRLSVVLPEDLKIIGSVYSGGMIGVLSQFDLGSVDSEYSITQMTLYYRRTVNLPLTYVALAEPDTSLIVMKTNSDERLPAIVIWLDASDVHNIGTESYMRPPTIFRDYTHYFEFLLDSE